jgi:hypothetical protein
VYFSTDASHNGCSFNKLCLDKKTNIIQKMLKETVDLLILSSLSQSSRGKRSLYDTLVEVQYVKTVL